jgi:hypothetical protein
LKAGLTGAACSVGASAAISGQEMRRILAMKAIGVINENSDLNLRTM